MTQEEALKKIKNRLGWPSIDLEVSDDQIQECINDAVVVLRDYATATRFITVALSGQPSDSLFSSYGGYVNLNRIEDFSRLVNVYKAESLTYPYYWDEFSMINYAQRGMPAGYAMAINIRSNIEALVRRSWRVIGDRLYVDKYYKKVTIEYIPKTIHIDDIEDSFYIMWALDYSIALVKEVLARIRGKFVVDSNPFRTDAETLASESATEKQELMAKLENHNLMPVSR